MHHFLKAIGFSKLKGKKQVDDLLRDIISHPDIEKLAIDSDGNEFLEITKRYNESFGITVCGECQDDNSFYMDYFYPVFWGNSISTDEAIEIERRTESESYAGVCDEMRLGVTLIFYLQNVAEYLNHKKAFGNVGNVTTSLAALSLGGKIILPISKNERQIQNIEKNNLDRSHLMAAAREGDEDAIESLTLEDIDTYSMISRRVATEDILTIVDSYFMPYGIESDQYSVLGQILEVRILKNNFTEEEMYVLKINTNDLIFDVCMNKKDLFGVPEPGRRFKGNIWMQGMLNYQD